MRRPGIPKNRDQNLHYARVGKHRRVDSNHGISAKSKNDESIGPSIDQGSENSRDDSAVFKKGDPIWVENLSPRNSRLRNSERRRLPIRQ